jgi:hypothetical protein
VSYKQRPCLKIVAGSRGFICRADTAPVTICHGSSIRCRVHKGMGLRTRPTTAKYKFEYRTVATRSASTSTHQSSAPQRTDEDSTHLFGMQWYTTCLPVGANCARRSQTIRRTDRRHCQHRCGGIADQFPRERVQGSRSDKAAATNVSAEDLRQTFKRYRALSDRSLAI